MGMDLAGAGGSFHWTNGGWVSVLAFARLFGWEGCGTGAPKRLRKKKWRGSYGGNEGQLVYARDAKALAEALARALAELPPVCPPELSFIEHYDWFFSPAGYQYTQQFIAFCRAGSFRIY
jgi:hypothetical protein